MLAAPNAGRLDVAVAEWMPNDEVARRMARENRPWGAERIRGELLKLGIRVAKRTVRHYMKQERSGRPASQSWSTFLELHARTIWQDHRLPGAERLASRITARGVTARSCPIAV